jgi:hypothetical protein
MSENNPDEKPPQPAKPAGGMNRAAIAGMAIGSAALVAALLYANRGRAKENAKEKKPPLPHPSGGTD